MANAQDFVNNEIKNEDAHYKKMARDLLVHDKLKADEEIPLNPHGFDAFYDNILMKDVKLPPRPIKESEYFPKSSTAIARKSSAETNREVDSQEDYHEYLTRRLELSHK